MRTPFTHPIVRVTVLGCLLVGMLWLVLAGRPGTAQAGGTVSGACTEADLDAALAGGGVVTFSCGGPVTITLKSEKLITAPTTINGPIGGGNRVTFDGAGTVRLFRVKSGAALVLLNDLALVNGSAINQGGAVLVDAGAELNAQNVRFEHNQTAKHGGAIGNYGRAVINGSTFYSNSAQTNGGAIDSTGLLDLAGNTFDQNYAGVLGGGVNNYLGDVRQSYPFSPSAFTGNRSGGYGGALVNDQGTLMLTSNFTDNHSSGAGGAFKNSGPAIITGTFAQNSSTGGDGGAIWNDASLFVGPSTFMSNQGGNGGAIYNSGMVTVTQSMFSGNSAGLGGGGILNSGTSTLNNSTLNGNSASSGGGLYNTSIVALTNVTVSGNSAGYGGGINNGGMATLNNSTLSGNSAAGGGSFSGGGGIYNWGTATLNNSTLSGNSAVDGGGIYNKFGSANLLNSTLSGNSAVNGGGIYNYLGSAKLLNSTLSGNSASQGGGMGNFGGMATLNNSTLGSNSASQGGGMYNIGGWATLNNSTLSGNSASNDGGAIWNDIDSTATLNNTILAYSPAGSNCRGPISASYSISSDNTCALTGLVKGLNPNNLDPLLTALGNYGGPTLVHMLKLGSPAIDGGDNMRCAQPYIFNRDQRGAGRLGPGNGTACDIGAVERQSNDSDLAPRLYLPLIKR
jgi:predicted outer membrane repeat protein